MESNVMFLYVYKENSIKYIKSQNSTAPFWHNSMGFEKYFGQYNTLVYLIFYFEGGKKSSLDINQQWAMTEHISCQTLYNTVWTLNTGYLCLHASMPTCFVFHISFSHSSVLLLMLDLVTWENPPMIKCDFRRFHVITMHLKLFQLKYTCTFINIIRKCVKCLPEILERINIKLRIQLCLIYNPHECK